MAAKASVHGLRLGWEPVEDVRDLPLAEQLKLWDGRPHARSLRLGSNEGYWDISLTDGIHWWAPGRAAELPLQSVDDVTHRPARGSGIFPVWTPDPDMQPTFRAAMNAAQTSDVISGSTTSRGRTRRLLRDIQSLERACDRGVSLNPQQMQKIRRKPALCEMQAIRRAGSAEAPLPSREASNAPMSQDARGVGAFIDVPHRDVGRMLGTGGKNVLAVQRASGARVQRSSGSASATLQRFDLFGSDAQVCSARVAIRALLAGEDISTVVAAIPVMSDPCAMDGRHRSRASIQEAWDSSSSCRVTSVSSWRSIGSSRSAAPRGRPLQRSGPRDSRGEVRRLCVVHQKLRCVSCLVQEADGWRCREQCQCQERGSVSRDNSASSRLQESLSPDPGSDDGDTTQADAPDSDAPAAEDEQVSALGAPAARVRRRTPAPCHRRGPTVAPPEALESLAYFHRDHGYDDHLIEFLTQEHRLPPLAPDTGHGLVRWEAVSEIPPRTRNRAADEPVLVLRWPCPLRAKQLDITLTTNMIQVCACGRRPAYRHRWAGPGQHLVVDESEWSVCDGRLEVTARFLMPPISAEWISFKKRLLSPMEVQLESESVVPMSWRPTLHPSELTSATNAGM